MSFITFKENDEIYTGTLIKEGVVKLVNHIEKNISDDMIIINYNTDDYIEFTSRQDKAYEIMKTDPQRFDNTFLEKFKDHCVKIQDEYVVLIQEELRKKTPALPSLHKKYKDVIGLRGLSNVIPGELCDRVNDLVNKKFDEKKEYDLTNLNYGKLRYELILENDGPVKELINILHEKIIGEKEEYTIHSITCFVSEPGATTQPYHRDFHEKDMYCIFVALQDITEEMGPPVFIPYTNTDREYNEYVKYRKVGGQIKNKFYAGTIKKGDIIHFDVRTLHAGTKNVSGRRRNMLAFTYYA